MLHLMLYFLHVYMLHVTKIFTCYDKILNFMKLWLNPSNFTFKMTNCLTCIFLSDQNVRPVNVM